MIGVACVGIHHRGLTELCETPELLQMVRNDCAEEARSNVRLSRGCSCVEENDIDTDDKKNRAESSANYRFEIFTPLRFVQLSVVPTMPIDASRLPQFRGCVFQTVVQVLAL